MTATARTRILSVLPILIGAALLFAATVFIHTVLQTISFAAVVESFWAMDIDRVVLALVLTVGSFLALCTYDVVAVRLIGRVLPPLKVAAVAAASYAFSQALGFGTLTGGAVRYRLYSALGLPATEIAQIVALSTLTFALGIALVGGFALLTEPGHLAQALSLSPAVLQLVGAGLVIGILVFLTWRAVQPQSIGVFGLTIPLQNLPRSLGQILLGSTDVILSAAALWVLLPDDAAMSLPAFAGLYAALILIGLLLHIPGSLGLLEAGLVLALPDAGKAEVLSAVLIYRAIYYVLPVVVATVGLGLIELRSFLYRIAPPSSPPRTLLYAAAPPLIAALTFASGIVLLFSSATPALQSRIETLKNFVPMPFVEVSHLLASIIGFALLVLASGLNHRLDGAWVITVFLLAVGIVVSLLKGLDFEEATILAIMLVVVLLARPAFYRSSSLLHDRPSRFVLITIVLAVAASIWVTFLAFADVPYSADLWWQVAWNAQAPRSIRAGLIVSVLTVIYALWLVLRPSRPRLADDDLMPVIRRIVAASANPDSNLALTGDKHFLVSDSADAFLMYSVQGRSWVAMSDPVGNPAAFDKLLWTYLEIVDQFGGRPIFYEITATHLPLYLDLGLSLMKIGEEATVDLTTFSLEGSARANLRRAVRRAEREQLIFDVIAKESVTPILPELQAVSDAWLSEKRGREKAFSVGRFSREYLLLFDQAVVRQDGDIIAFANIWQSAGDGLSVDLMRYKPGAPNGLMDFLFCRLMLWGHTQGFKKFSLGMAPLAGLQKHALAPTWHKAGNLLFEYGEELYGLAGLRAYKDKFRPVWQPRYLAVPGGLSLPSVILDLIVLISRPRRVDLGPAPSIRSASA